MWESWLKKQQNIASLWLHVEHAFTSKMVKEPQVKKVFFCLVVNVEILCLFIMHGNCIDSARLTTIAKMFEV